QVVVGRDDADAPLDPVVEDDAVAVAAVVVLRDDRAGGGRPDRRAAADAEVGAVVQLVHAGDRMATHAVGRGDRTGDRSTQRSPGVAGGSATAATAAATAAAVLLLPLGGRPASRLELLADDLGHL